MLIKKFGIKRQDSTRSAVSATLHDWDETASVTRVTSPTVLQQIRMCNLHESFEFGLAIPSVRVGTEKPFSMPLLGTCILTNIGTVSNGNQRGGGPKRDDDRACYQQSEDQSLLLHLLLPND